MSDKFYDTQMLLLGIHPNLPLRKWHIVFNLSAVSVLFCLTLYNFYQNMGLKEVESFGYYFIVFVKYLTVVFGRTVIKQLSSKQEHFWKPYESDNQIAFLCKHLKVVKKCYKFIFVAAVAMFPLPILFTKSSVFNCYVPPQLPFPVFFVMEFYVTLMGACTFTSYNALICSLIVNVVIQFRMLNLKIVEINFGAVTSNEELQRCRKDFFGKIKYQQFLIRYVKDLNKLLSAPVALLMVISVSLLCMCMYILSAAEDSLVDQFRVIVATLALVVEFFLVYGLPSQILMDESAGTAAVIYYECKWYLSILSPMRKDFLLVMTRSQKIVCISLGDYYIVSNQTIVLMLKTAYSFFSFLQGAGNK